MKQKGYKHIALSGLSLASFVSLMAYTDDIECLVLFVTAINLKHFYDRYKEQMLKKGYYSTKRYRTVEQWKVYKPIWEEFGRLKLG